MGDGKAKKEKKAKRHKKDRKSGKKEKKAHKHKRREELSTAGTPSSRDDASSPDAQPASGQIQEAPTEPASAAVGMQREDWMLRPRPRSRPPQREGGGTSEAERAVPQSAQVSETVKGGLVKGRAPTTSGALVGDGGASWKMKRLKRLQQQAKQEGKTLEELGLSRGIDVAKLLHDAMATPAAHALAHQQAARERTRALGGARDGGARGHGYMADVKSDASKMRKPQEGRSLSWRKPDGAARGGGRDRGGPILDPALARLAPSLNKFEDDGKFMERYKDEDQSQGEEDHQHNPQVAEQSYREQSPKPPQRTEAESTPERPSERLGSSGGGGGSLRAGTEATNRSAADLLRARLMGKRASAQQEGAAEGTARSDEPAVVQLPMVDAHGRAAPGAFGREAALRSSGKPSTKFGGDGKRERYFDDDDADLRTLVKRARHGDDGGDVDAAMARRIAGRKQFKAADMNADDEYDFDVGIDALEARGGGRRRREGGGEVDRQKRRQITDLKRLNAVEEGCVYCLSCPRRPKHLMVAMGNCAYLRLPERGRLVPGHCMIVPMEHTPSCRRCEDDAWTELRNFKKALLQMFHAKDQEVLFMETALRLDDYKRHAVVECVPVPPGTLAKAPMHFKAAIDTATSDWSQHHAKRIIETGRKGLHGSIPPNFPYFFVEFGLSNGYVHVVDDVSTFDAGFGRKVVAGLLRLPPEDVHGRNKGQARRTHDAWIADFQKHWGPFDWTKMLM
ncbi:unnamed protein product [Ostreobium quekettii]|uniref:CWF19-like protein 2 n=1 Tax=Ostreobium quekettii TaxID=121088 RepID=A0A8S1JFJ3_9CHLO|nr:unnamed protein product [Ostreobium quekettii]